MQTKYLQEEENLGMSYQVVYMYLKPG